MKKYILSLWISSLVLSSFNAFSNELSCLEALRRALVQVHISHTLAPLSQESAIDIKNRYRSWISFFRYKTGRNATIAEDTASSLILEQIDSVLFLKNEYQLKEYFFPQFQNMTLFHSQFLENEKKIQLLSEEALSVPFYETQKVIQNILNLKLKNIKLLKKMGKSFNEYRTMYSKLESYTKLADPSLVEFKNKANNVFNGFFQSEKFTQQILPPDTRTWYPARPPQIRELWKILEEINYGALGERMKLRYELLAEMGAFFWRYSPTRASMDIIEGRILAKIPIVNKSFVRLFFRTFKDTQSQRLYYPLIYELENIQAKKIIHEVGSDVSHTPPEGVDPNLENVLSENITSIQDEFPLTSRLHRFSSQEVYNAELAELQFKYIARVNSTTVDEFLITMSRRSDFTQTRDYIKRFIKEKILESQQNNVEHSSFQNIYDRFLKAEAEAKILGDLHPVSSPFLLQLFGNSMDVIVLSTGSYLTYGYFTFESKEGLVEIPTEETKEDKEILEGAEVISKTLKAYPEILENIK